MRNLISVLSVTAIAIGSSAAASELQEHVERDVSVEELKQLAASGDHSALLDMGHLYLYGEEEAGIEVDEAKGEQLIRSSAALGNKSAYVDLLNLLSGMNRNAEMLEVARDFKHLGGPHPEMWISAAYAAGHGSQEEFNGTDIPFYPYRFIGSSVSPEASIQATLTEADIPSTLETSLVRGDHAPTPIFELQPVIEELPFDRGQKQSGFRASCRFNLLVFNNGPKLAVKDPMATILHMSVVKADGSRHGIMGNLGMSSGVAGRSGVYLGSYKTVKIEMVSADSSEQPDEASAKDWAHQNCTLDDFASIEIHGVMGDVMWESETDWASIKEKLVLTVNKRAPVDRRVAD